MPPSGAASAGVASAGAASAVASSSDRAPSRSWRLPSRVSTPGGLSHTGGQGDSPFDFEPQDPFEFDEVDEPAVQDPVVKKKPGLVKRMARG